jgi:hypothetical protein
MAAARTILRWFGLALLTAAFVAFVLDGTRVIAGGPLAAASLGQIAGDLASAGLTALQAEITALGGDGLWQAIDGVLLALPAFAALGIAGILLMYVGRRREAWRRLARGAV